MSNEKQSIMDKLVNSIDKIAGPMTNFGQIPVIRAIVNGMVAAVGITMIGSIFLIIFLFAADGNLTEHALLPFLSPYAGDIILVNSLTMNIMAVYMAISMGAEYAEIKGFNKTTGAIGSFFAFMLLNYNGIASLAESGESGLSIAFWGGAGVITAIVAAVISINVIDFCYKRNIKITLPDSVPPAIADSFSAIIPYFFITLIAWGIRTLLGINIPALIATMLLPIFSAADNVFIFTFAHFMISLLWICGLHGDNIVNAVTGAFTNTWMIDNNAAFVAGQEIPYIWVPNLNRLFMWVSSCWPILFYMFKSSKKLPHLKPLATICFPPAIFCIVEPMMFGLPIVLNPFLVIPFLLSHTVTAALTYVLTSVGFVGRMYLQLPWATPSPILGYLSTGGSVGGILVVVINFLIGLVIFYPFWHAYEKAEIVRLEQEAQEAMEAA